MVSVDGVPAAYRHLSGSDKIIKKAADGNLICLVVVDCSDPERVGFGLDGYGQPDINIDHHITNLLFANA